MAALKERLAEMEAECASELAELEAAHKAAVQACRERHRAKAAGEHARSEQRVAERADALLLLVATPGGPQRGRGLGAADRPVARYMAPAHSGEMLPAGQRSVHSTPSKGVGGRHDEDHRG